MRYQSILKTFLVGTERSPLPEEDRALPDLPVAADPAQATLDALATANLLRKAGFPLASFATPTHAVSHPDECAVCSEAAAGDLHLMLNGHHAEALPEFLGLLAERRLRLPPEFLPEFLEKAARSGLPAGLTGPAIGQRGRWLAQQHPSWSALAAEAETDWFTASLAARLALLKTTRERNPMLALAWLEKTWVEEKAAHRVQFLEALHIRLSPADEDLLVKAFADKSREVRWTAARLLALLSGSDLLEQVRSFFTERLAGAVKPSQRDALLREALPDLSEDAVQPWVTLLPPAAKGDWRRELFFMFISLLPPAELPALCGLSREEILSVLDDEKGMAALTAAIVLHADAAWTEGILRRLSRNFRHPWWQSREMNDFFDRFAVETTGFLQRNEVSLNYDNQRILRALENYRRPWPGALLQYLLEQYRRAAFEGRAEVPGWHFALALQTAAYYCLPADAVENRVVRDYLQYTQPVRPREFESFLTILRFRQKMKEHLSQ